MPGTLLVPAGLGGVAARLEVMLEEMLEVRGLPTGRMASTSCKERARTGDGMPAQEAVARAEGGRENGASQPSCGCPQAQTGPHTLDALLRD